MQTQKMSQAVEEKVEGLRHQKGQDVALQAALAAPGLGGSEGGGRNPSHWWFMVKHGKNDGLMMVNG